MIATTINNFLSGVFSDMPLYQTEKRRKFMRERTIFEKYGYTTQPTKEQLKQFCYMLALEDLNKKYMNRSYKGKRLHFALRR